MATERSTDIKVGLTVIVGLAVLFFGITWGKGWRIFGGKQFVLQAKFATTGGLESGDPVCIGGVKEGSVTDIIPTGDSVLVSMAFDHTVSLSKDTRARITMLELMGGKKIELDNGSSTERLKDSTVLAGTFSGDIGSLVAMVTDISGTLKSMAGRADSVLASMNDILRNGEFKKTINTTLADADKTLRHFDETAGKVNSLIAETSSPLKQTLASAQSATKDLADLLKSPKIHNLLDTTGAVMTDAHSMILKATAIFGSIDTMLSEATRNHSLLYKLTQDKQFGQRLDNLVTSLLKFVEQTRKGGLDANIRFWDSNRPDTGNYQ